MNPINRYLILVGSMLFATLTWALPQDKQQAIAISADRAEINESNGTAIYSGNVKLSQGSLQLDADQLTLHTDGKGDIRRLVAQGQPAHFQQQHQQKAPITHGFALTIEFDIQLDLLTLTEQAKLLRADNSFSGKRIQVDTTKNVIQAFSDKLQPDSRVQMIIQPRSKQAPATAAPAGDDNTASADASPENSANDIENDIENNTENNSTTAEKPKP
ncbi:MAG: lipopolysaccharide transport periplasmic protein LptA [Motiliproteus sp.]